MAHGFFVDNRNVAISLASQWPTKTFDSRMSKRTLLSVANLDQFPAPKRFVNV
jgi:hypothetical protein